MSGFFLSRAAFSCLGLVLACSGENLTLPGSTETPGPEPASLQIVSGDDQRAEAGTVLEKPLRVQALDGSGQPMSEVAVQFSFTDEVPGAGVVPSSLRTNQEGHAAAFARLGTTPGEQVIRASVAGSESPDLTVLFRATAISGENDGGGEGGGGDDGDGDDDGGDGNGDGGGGGSGGGDDGGSGGGSDDDDEGSDGDSEIGAAPDRLEIPAGHYPPPGSCRVWLPSVSPGQQTSPTSCVSVEQQAPPGSWIIARPEGVSGLIHVLVVDPDRAGVVVRLWVYDANSGRLLTEQDV